MKITACERDDLRDGEEFIFVKKPTVQAPSTFTAITDTEVIVTRRFSNLESLPDKTPAIAHWHGQYRTEGFLSTVGDLKKKSKTLGVK
jgi:hypothetical protein